MGWFKNIILIAAFNDGYVNYESAKILLGNKYLKNNTSREMAMNIYKNIKSDRLIKIGYYIPNLHKGMDYFLGRGAHIDILDNTFLMMIIFQQIKYFLN